MKKTSLAFTVCLLLLVSQIPAQNNSNHLRISLLTCDPGEEMYALFGHTALRIYDSSQHTDLVYNYGTFDFNDPDFYSKFVKGKLDYFLSVEDFPAFLYEYQVTHRNIIEQLLLLDEGSKNALKQALDSNLAGTNRYYKYDFLYDNCTTRIRDLLENHAGLSVKEPIVPRGISFRDMIHGYLDRSGQSWTKLGMDLLLGRPTDKKVSIQESLFLPDHLMRGVDLSKSIPAQKRILDMQGTQGQNRSVNWPFWVFCVVTMFILVVSYFPLPRFGQLTLILDSILLLVTGLLGCLFLFTWLGTDHGSFAQNYNLLWAIPTQVIAALAIWKKPAWLANYFLICSLVYGGLLVSWYWLPQQLNPALIPITLLLFFRSVRFAQK